MKKLLRYLVNTILFVAIWCIPAFIFVGISLSVSGTRPSAIAGVGGIVAIIISYKLVKRINKSNLWASLFNETEAVNDVVEEKKVEVVKEKTKKKVEVEDSNIFNPKNITIGILAIVLISFLYFQFGGTLEDTKDYNIPEQTEYNVDDEILLLEKKFSKAIEEYLSLNRFIGGGENSNSEINELCFDGEQNLLDCHNGSIISSHSNGPFITTFKVSNQPVTGIIDFQNGHESVFKKGLFTGLSIWDSGSFKRITLQDFKDGYKIDKKYSNGRITETTYETIGTNFKRGRRIKTIKH